jgi:hypothetical protein
MLNFAFACRSLITPPTGRWRFLHPHSSMERPRYAARSAFFLSSVFQSCSITRAACRLSSTALCPTSLMLPAKANTSFGTHLSACLAHTSPPSLSPSRVRFIICARKRAGGLLRPPLDPSFHILFQSRFNDVLLSSSAAHPLQPPAPRRPLDNDDLDDILANADSALLMCEVDDDHGAAGSRVVQCRVF